MSKNSKTILLKINDIFSSLDDFHQITQFQISRANFISSNSCWIYDPDDLLSKFDFHYDKIISKENLLNWLDSRDPNELLVLTDSSTSFLDDELIQNVSTQIHSQKNQILGIEGAIPGSSPSSVTTVSYFKTNFSNHLSWFTNRDDHPKFYWDSQRIHNNQFDLNRPLRVGIFLKLIKKIDSLERLSFKEFLNLLNQKEIFDFILDYGLNNIKTKELENCPHCNSKNLKPLYFSTSQPAIGFLSSKFPSYFKCLDCLLVFLRKECDVSNLHMLYDKYERPKINEEKAINDYLTNNASSHFLEKLQEIQILDSLMLKDDISFLDIGGGFGEFSTLIKKNHPSWTVNCIDFDMTHVENILEKNNVNVINKNFLIDDIGSGYDVITLNHVIEHIPFNHLLSFLTKIKNSLNDDGYFLLTTPNYDSPLAKFFDYHLTFLPQHQTILSEYWLENFIQNNNLFKKIKSDSACVLFERYQNWFSYYKKTTPSEQLQNTIKIFDTLHEDQILFKKFFQNLNSLKMGSEIIMLFQK